MSAWTPRTPLDRVAQPLGAFIVRHRAGIATTLLVGLTIGWLQPKLPALATPDGALLAIAAVVPVALALVAIRYTDRTSLEPWGLLFRTFFLGAAIAVVAALVNTMLGWLPSVAHYILVVGPGEELAKVGAIYIAAYTSREFDHAIDGLYYGVAAGAGFAAIENIAVAVGSHEGWTILLARTLISTPNHVLWAAVAGYYLGVAKFIPEHRTTLITKGILIAAGAHSLYDLVIGWPDPWGVAAGALLGITVLAFLLSKVRKFYDILGPAILLGAAQPTGEEE